MSNETIEIMLTKLDDLIEEINVKDVSVDEEIDLSDFVTDPNSSENSEVNQTIIDKTQEFLIALKDVNFPGDIIQYSTISVKMFGKKKDFDAVENISATILKVATEHFDSMLNESNELNKRFYKLIDHIQLATFQISEITDHYRVESEELKKELSQRKNDLDKIKEDFSKLSIQNDDMISSLKKEVSKINVQFVTILGIFTAVVTSVFGGLQIISTAFSTIHLVPMWKVILTGSLSTLAVLSMLFILTKWISSIINITYEKTEEASLLEILTNNGAFTTGVFIFTYLLCVAVVFSSEQVSEQFKSIINQWSSYPILILLTLPLIVGIGVFIKVLDKRKFKHNI